MLGKNTLLEKVDIKSAYRTVLVYPEDRVASKKQLESLVGILQYATKVVKPGRRFVRRIIELLASVRSPRHLTLLNNEIWSDLQWWGQFTERWNGICLCTSFPRKPNCTPGD